MRYSILLKTRRYEAPNHRFAVWSAREIHPDTTLGGWAVVVFRSKLPAEPVRKLHVWGDWTEDAQHGRQLIVRTWLPWSEEDPEPV